MVARFVAALVCFALSACAAPARTPAAFVAAGPEGRQVVAGAATVAHGTPLDANARVYVLDTNSPREFRRYWAIGDDLLLLLDESGGPKVGTAAWSYTLSRTR